MIIHNARCKSLELGTIIEGNGNIFDFNYEFYDHNLKGNFERKFIDHYYFDEIGQETIQRFKQRLKSRLNMKMPYYKQLYLSELKAKNIDFLLNKDYKETYEKTLDSFNKYNDSVNGLIVGKGSATDSSVLNSKGSHLENGNASINLSEGYLTDIENSNNTNNNNFTNSTDNKQMTTKENEDKTIEKFTLEGKGNIGITSSAELLEKWRNVMINLDEIIIEDCYDLFSIVLN